MKRAAAIAIAAAGLSTVVLAQPEGQKMGASSAVVFGSTANDKGGRDLVNRGGGFFIDSRHVVTSLESCCGKTDKGEIVLPVMPNGQENISAKVIWSSEDSEIAILELPQPFSRPGVTISPTRLQQEGEAVYSVQYPKPGDQSGPQVVQGKMTGPGSKDQKIPLWVTTIQMGGYNKGGALFDACANVIGVNYGMKDSEEFAFQSDVLIDALRAAGVQANITSQPCGSAGSASGGGGASGGGAGGGGGKQTKGKEEEVPASGPWWMPKGQQWIPVVIVVGLLVLAFRPARQKVAQAMTGRYQAIPEPAPYPSQGLPGGMAGSYGGMPPMGEAPMGTPQGYAAPGAPYVPPAYVPGAGLKPVLKGIAGQYAGSAFPLESGASTLGRDPHAANLVFGGEASSVSKRHCSVRWDAGRGVFLVEDHGSTNGTFLASGERLTPNLPRELRAGERFYIGDLRNQFEVALEA